MKQIITTACICLLAMPIFAQTLHIESGANVYISGPAEVNGVKSNTPTLFVEGDVVNNGLLSNSGELQITGNITNNGGYASSGDDVFTGNATQTLNGSFNNDVGNHFYNLVLDKAGTDLQLTGHISVAEGIYLTDGVLVGNGNITHLENDATTALHSTAPSGSANNYINGILRQDIATGTYVFHTGDAVHNNQKVTVTFNNTGSANYMDVSYNSAGAGPTVVNACGGVYDKQSGTWSLTPDGVNGTYDYSITLDAGGLNLAAISPSVYDGILKDGIFITNPCDHIAGNNTVSGLNSFSDFKKVSTINAVLPVTLLYFNGKKMSSYDELNWETSSEINNNYFNVQKSTDGTHFSTMTRVNTKALNGNSQVPLHYTVNDNSPLAGNNYYRLEQVDIDGQTSYSNVINLIWDGKAGDVTLSPNPAGNTTTVSVYSDKAAAGTVKLMDMSGRTVKLIKVNYEIGYNTIDLSLDEFAQGNYQVNVYSNDLLLKSLKLNKH
ncbi:MAG: T9SS type A sorting domain-containing protein [Chitinophagaceae bacterium]|nr:T9SS type A sorting domain-containing protein [Chitinophagaceae bacterium]